MQLPNGQLYQRPALLQEYRGSRVGLIWNAECGCGWEEIEVGVGERHDSQESRKIYICIK